MSAGYFFCFPVQSRIVFQCQDLSGMLLFKSRREFSVLFRFLRSEELSLRSLSAEVQLYMYIVTLPKPREMENISRGSTFGDFVTILTQGPMQDNTVARLRSTRVQTPLPTPHRNVLHESLSEDSQNIPCAMLKRRESWVISVHLCLNCTIYI